MFYIYILRIIVNAFPHTTILQQTTLNVFCQNIENLHNWMVNLWQKVKKHCGKRRNCTFCAISSFVTMFSKRRLLQRCQKASIWGKGLIIYCNYNYTSYHIRYFKTTCNGVPSQSALRSVVLAVKCRQRARVWHCYFVHIILIDLYIFVYQNGAIKHLEMHL